jgi:CRISPR-associated protein Cas1
LKVMFMSEMEILTLTDFGLHVGKHSERLIVKKGKETVSEHPLINLEQVVVAGRGISVSSDAIAECVERGIPMTFVDFSGKPYAKIVSPALTATVKTRREQLLAYYDERGVEIVRRFAVGKIRNQINLLRYFGKYRKETQPEVFEQLQGVVGKMTELVKELRMSNIQCPMSNEQDPTTQLIGDSPIDVLRERFMNVEGRAAALYWQGVKAILPDGLFKGREHRGATDVVNALLNYGYGILYSQVWTALTLAGLEPFGGFLHVDRPGKPSLVLDFIEEFRQPIVDRIVFALLNKGFQVEWELPNEQELKAQHQGLQSSSPSLTPPSQGEELSQPANADTPTLPNSHTPTLPLQEQQRLSAVTRKAFAAKVMERLNDAEPFEGKRHKLKNVIQMQARHLATFLRREGDYQPFVTRW